MSQQHTGQEPHVGGLCWGYLSSWQNRAGLSSVAPVDIILHTPGTKGTWTEVHTQSFSPVTPGVLDPEAEAWV